MKLYFLKILIVELECRRENAAKISNSIVNDFFYSNIIFFRYSNAQDVLSEKDHKKEENSTDLFARSAQRGDPGPRGSLSQKSKRKQAHCFLSQESHVEKVFPRRKGRIDPTRAYSDREVGESQVGWTPLSIEGEVSAASVRINSNPNCVFAVKSVKNTQLAS